MKCAHFKYTVTWILTNVYVHGVPIMIKMWTISIASRSSAVAPITASCTHTWPEATPDLPSDTKDLIYRFWNFFEMESYNICSAYLFLSPIFLSLCPFCCISPSLFLFLLARAALHGHRKACECPCSWCTFGLIPVSPVIQGICTFMYQFSFLLGKYWAVSLPSL